MCEYFSFVWKANEVRFQFHQNKAYALNILFACLCEFFKDCCLVYFCTTYYEISQFVSSIITPVIYLKSVLSPVLPLF